MIKLNKPLVFFDLETTGTNVSSDRIVQIAIVRWNVDGSIDSKVRLINPGISIPIEATEVHGVDDDMVRDQPTFQQLSKGIQKEFEGCDIGGYNSDNFDIPLLSQEFERCGISFPDDETAFLDVYKVEKIVNSHKLGETFKRYTGETLDDAHDALADAQGTKIVFTHQMSRLSEIMQENDENAVEITIEMIDKFCQGEKKRFDIAGKTYLKDGIVYWSFGKNMNQPVLKDRGYLGWVLNQDFPIETKNRLNKLITDNQ